MNPSSLLYPILAGAALVLSPMTIRAEATDEDATAEEQFTIKPHGFAGLQSFYVHAYKSQGYDYPHEIFNNSVLNFTFDLASGKNLTIRAGLEGYVTFSTIAYNKLGNVGTGKTEAAVPLWSWYMAQAEMAYSLGEKGDNFYGDVGVGLFPYKYDEEARNLGEYMFRSGTYPGWLITTFDWTTARLTGFRFSSTAWNKWHNDLMLTTEMEWYPFYDLSLSWITDYRPNKVIDIGGGLDFARLIPADSKLTTPEISSTGDKQVTNYYTSNCNATGTCDTSYYTFQGVKAMGRVTLDPKMLFLEKTGTHLGEWGKEDARIFGEAAVLGLKNQGTLYNDIKQRTPVMFGVNIPTFNLLDVLSFQMEYYAMPYPNDYSYQVQFVGYGVPQPTQGWGYGTPGNPYSVADSTTGQTNFYAHHHWYWSAYARRWLGNHLAIVAQVARDHWRTNTPYANHRDSEEALSKPKQWYTALKIVSVW